MKQFFEGIRRWTALNEEQLLAEGRVKDAKKKYPDIANFVPGLTARDPSGNNKYLMWSMKQL